MASCTVSYLDTTGVRHTVEVQAQTLYEAAAMAVCAFKTQDCEPVGMHELNVEIRTSITHTLTVQRLHEWLNGGSRNPKDAVTKERLRSLLKL